MWEYWGECGEIEALDVMTFPDSGRFRGIAFITFKTVSQCAASGLWEGGSRSWSWSWLMDSSVTA